MKRDAANGAGRGGPTGLSSGQLAGSLSNSPQHPGLIHKANLTYPPTISIKAKAKAIGSEPPWEVSPGYINVDFKGTETPGKTVEGIAPGPPAER